jgi:hypothetical protein
LPASIVSAQDNADTTGPVNSVDMDKQMSQMQENMKVMQQQMKKNSGRQLIRTKSRS